MQRYAAMSLCAAPRKRHKPRKENINEERRMAFFDIGETLVNEGVAKPDPEIFRRALTRAGCTPENAVMIGDRLDNDIYPAKRLGMKTVRVLQGFSAYLTPENEDYTADFTVKSLSGIALKLADNTHFSVK